MKKNVIHCGDIVKVVNPEFFIRCGYPLSIKDGIKMILENDSLERQSVLKISEVFGINIDSYRFQEILKTLSYFKIKKEKFGGKERKIYTRRIEDQKDKFFKVYKKKTVMTGNYVSGCGYSTIDGDEYDPPYLDKQKAHQILYIEQYDIVQNFTRSRYIDINFDDDLYPLAIEEINVEKYTGKEKI